MCRPQGVLPHTFRGPAMVVLDVPQMRFYMGKRGFGVDCLSITAGRTGWGGLSHVPSLRPLTLSARLTVEAPSGYTSGRMQGEQVPKALISTDVGWTSGSWVGRSSWPRGALNLSHSAGPTPYSEPERA
jgi:hypothetical protein